MPGSESFQRTFSVLDHRIGALVRVHSRRAAEVAHLRTRGHARVEPDQRDVLRVLEDRVGELADPVAVAVACRRAGPRRPRLLPGVAAQLVVAQDAVACGADVARDPTRTREQHIIC